MAITKAAKYTAHDYFQLDDGRRYELVEGELVMVPAPTPYHQEVSSKIQFALIKYVKEKKTGKVYAAPCDVVLGTETVLQPDIFFIAGDREGIISEKNIQGAPDLVVEILSSGSAYRDMVSKKQIYARHNVKEYWIVDPTARTIDVFVLQGNRYGPPKQYKEDETLVCALLSGFSLTLTEVF